MKNHAGMTQQEIDQDVAGFDARRENRKLTLEEKNNKHFMNGYQRAKALEKHLT